MQKTVTHYRTDGTQEEIAPANGKKFTLDEMQKLVGGKCEWIHLPSGSMIVMNEEGMLDQLPRNEGATGVWQSEFPIEEYPHNNLAYTVGILGDALVGSKQLLS